MHRLEDEGAGPAPPTISVVISAFTIERFALLEGAITSVRLQTLPAHEIVLVIDHAPDLRSKSRERWPELTLIDNGEAQGLSGARNAGLAASTGEIVAFLDDDAIAATDWLEKSAAAYSDDRVIGVGGTVRPRWAEGRPRWFPPEFDWVVGCTHSGMPRERTPVRNLVGANMSFRHSAVVEVGGFRHGLGRVGDHPAGGEETDLCIRLGKRWPEGVILFDPAVSVDHIVPAKRGDPRYFRARCAAEGHSKAVLSSLVGSPLGLESERAYVRHTIPLGVIRGLGDVFRGDASGAARAAAIIIGLATTTAGYAVRRGVLRRLAVEPYRSPNEPLRILIVTPRNPLGHGGVERHVMEVSRRLAAVGADVEVLCAEPGGAAVGEQLREGVLIRSVRAWPAQRDFYLAPRIWSEMARRPWDVVHVQSYHTAVAPLAMLRALRLGIPYVVTFHGGGHSSALRNRLRRVQRRTLLPLLARAERLIAVARFEIDLYSAELGLPREKFEWIPNGTDLNFDVAADGEHPATPGLLASIGRLERYKGHHRVIEALPHVLAGRADARLLVVGTGPYEHELRRQAKELGIEDQIEFTSIPPDDRSGMARLLRRVSLVVLLSEFESHPLVALEAAAAGRALLVANAGGLAELAADGLARPIALGEDSAAVAAAILEELDEPAAQRPLLLASWDDCANALLELYRSVA